MASPKLNSQDRKDLDKFTKFFTLKCVQIIVQSRLGEKIKTKSKPHSSGADWFNLAIKDIPEVVSEAKKAICGQLLAVGHSLCVEISLKTVEGDSMVIENWILSVTDHCDPNVRVTYTVYNRMGLLLKSLIAVTRVTTGYKLSRRQGPDSYVICYKVYMGEPQFHNLGEGYQSVKIGQVGTPVGTYHLTVAYRTKMTITPQRVERETPFMVKSDHFQPDLSPRHCRPLSDRHLIDGRETGATSDDSQDACRTFSTSPPDLNSSPRFSCPSDREKVSLSENTKLGAFADVDKKTTQTELIVPDVPFFNLLNAESNTANKNKILHTQNSSSQATNTVPANNNTEPLEPVVECSGSNSRRSSGSLQSGGDDFVIVELKTPFAGSDPNIDLGAFFRECQSAPPLMSFSDQPCLAEQVNDIGDQLQKFEANMKEYDDLLFSLYQDESN